MEPDNKSSTKPGWFSPAEQKIVLGVATLFLWAGTASVAYVSGVLKGQNNGINLAKPRAVIEGVDLNNDEYKPDMLVINEQGGYTAFLRTENGELIRADEYFASQRQPTESKIKEQTKTIDKNAREALSKLESQ